MMACERYEVSVVLVDLDPDDETRPEYSSYRCYEFDDATDAGRLDEHTAEAAIAAGVIGYAGGRSAEYLTKKGG